MLSDLLYRLRALFRRHAVEAELDEELRFHLERQSQKYRQSGMSPREAARHARLAFGGPEQVREECRDARGTRWLEDGVRDLRYALRTLRNSPVFALTAALTLALGIGASTAIFSVTNAVLLRPLPYRNPDRLVLACKDSARGNVRDVLFSNADFFDLRDGTKTVFDDMGAVFTFRALVPREDGSAEQISKAQVTTNFFGLMGAKIALGRDFASADGQPQPVPPEAILPLGSVAILSHEYWQRRYGGDAAVIGREMLSYGQRGPRIVGVLAPGFKLLFPPSAATDSTPDVWIANNLGYDNARRNLISLRVIGCLKKGVGLERAHAQAGLVAAELRKNFPSLYATSELHIRLEPMHKHLVAEVRPVILALMGAALFLLLIACANVANLLLVRASLRERELAVRTALGGGWWRLMRQLLAESALLAGLGTLLGVGLAWLGVHALLLLAPANLPRLESIAIDGRVLAFAAATGLAAVAVFGVMPALGAARLSVIDALRGGGNAAALAAGRRWRNGVVIAEVALSFVLLVGSGLMFRSYRELQRIDAGYDAHGVLTFFLARDWNYASPPRQRAALLREIQGRLRALPGVESVAAAAFFPLTGGFSPTIAWGTEPGRADPAKPQTADFRYVLPGYFETLRTPLLAGRTFTEDDNAPGRNVAVIDQLLAAKAFPNQSAVGKRLFVPLPQAAWVEVIGVVAHQRQASQAERGREQIYFTEGFAGFGIRRYWAIRTAGDPATYAAAVRAELAKLDRQLVISKMQPMEALVEREQAGTRFALLLIGAFAAIAALLAGVGLYGVLSTVVRQRTAEIGVRMALGAAPASIFNLVAGHGLRLSAAGIALGLLAAFGLTRLITSMLVGVKATDPSTFAAMAVLFFLFAAVASWLPARRAARVDPLAALRHE